jgi:hypothetical protein
MLMGFGSQMFVFGQFCRLQIPTMAIGEVLTLRCRRR